MKYILITFFLLFTSTVSFSQVEKTSELFKTLKTNDSLLFNIGYNHQDITQFENLLSESFEFYHDEGGATHGKAAFIASIKDGLFTLPYKPRRELDENSVDVYPLENGGVLYGAVQTGTHKFYALEKNKPEYLTSTAKFTHLWLLENGKWKLSRVMSYGHKK